MAQQSGRLQLREVEKCGEILPCVLLIANHNVQARAAVGRREVESPRAEPPAVLTTKSADVTMEVDLIFDKEKAYLEAEELMPDK